jgi:hypothetical protein
VPAEMTCRFSSLRTPAPLDKTVGAPIRVQNLQ